MKTLLLICGLCLGFVARGQGLLVLPITNAIPASGSQTVNAVIACAGVEDVALQVSFALVGAGTSAITTTVQSSLDQTNWCPHLSWTITAAGATTVAGVTNFHVGAVPFLRVSTIANGNATNLTGLTLSRYIKRLQTR